MRHQSNNSPRKVIAVDLDEVLARTSLAIAEFHNDTYGTSLTMEDFVSYDYTKVWGGTREESITKWRLFFDSPYFLKVEPVEGSLETLKLLKSRRFSLVIITARQQFVADLTKKFVDRHFPGIFESIYFANHFLTEQEKLTFISKPKSVICRDVHAQLLIDDSLENAIEVAKAGIPVLLFDLHGKYKWNKLEDDQSLPDKVTRVKSWKDVQAWFPRPRSPLSNLCISIHDQISDESESEAEDDDEGEEEEDEDDEDDDEGQHDYHSQHQQRYQNQDRFLTLASDDSESDEDLYTQDEEMNEMSKREQDGEDDDHQGRNQRRRKLMMMDFSSSEEDEDIDLDHHGENMDSDEQDLDLESGHGGRNFANGGRRISHEELERYRHQHETMYTDEHGMELEMQMEVASTTSTAFAQEDDDMERGMLFTSTTTTTTTTQVSISAGAVDVDCPSSDSAESNSTPTSPEDMVVEGLTIKSPPLGESEFMVASVLQTDKSNMDMEEVPLS
ncbi:hypothetical protein BGZ51_008672 [Haplosporangium sp. Z 767]|nr:hypothetical protein BGZ50_002282 [Haplosporangium sp. Z 11]KAF9190379.1 hypothetical protein BGZ51_008672 [Haplosporangium sp. Z 767]